MSLKSENPQSAYFQNRVKSRLLIHGFLLYQVGCNDFAPLFCRWWLPTQQDTSKFCTVDPPVWRTHQKWSVLAQLLHVYPHIKGGPSTHPTCFHPLSPKTSHTKHWTPPWSRSDGHWRVCTRGWCSRGNRHPWSGELLFHYYTFQIYLPLDRYFPFAKGWSWQGNSDPLPSPPPSPPIPLGKGLSTFKHPIIAPPPSIKDSLLFSLLTHPLSILAEHKPISEYLRKFWGSSSPF